MKLKYYSLLLKSLLNPFKIVLDGTDNTITISSSLYNALCDLGLMQNNHIYMFSVLSAEPKAQRPQDQTTPTYGFCLYPTDRDPAKTITRPVQYNDYYKCFGFEAACPTCQSIFYTWNLPPDTKHKTTCYPTLTKDNRILFIIK